MIRIAKDFKWEMSHRLPFHKGLCRNIHGHTYKMRVELVGEPNEESMILDYYDMKQVVNPLIEKLDHSFMVDENDIEIIEFLQKMGMKYQVISDYTTAENITTLILAELAEGFRKYENIKYLKVRIHETRDTFAEEEIKLND